MAQRTTIIKKEQIEHAFIYRDGDTFYGAIVGATSEILAASITANASGMVTLPLWAAKPTQIATAGRIVYVTDTDPIVAGIYVQTPTEWIRLAMESNFGTTMANKTVVDEQLTGAINNNNMTYQTSSEFIWDTFSVTIQWYPLHEHNRLLRGVHYIQAGSDTIQMATPVSPIDPYDLGTLDIRLYASYVKP